MATRIWNTTEAKLHNIDKIRELLKRVKSATRAEISRETGLSIATCGNLLKKLIASGEVSEEGYETENGGRPARKYKYNGVYVLAAGIAVEQENEHYVINSYVSDLHGEILDSKQIECTDINNKAVQKIIEIIKKDFPTIKSAVMGLPDITNNLHNMPNTFDGIKQADLISYVQKEHDIDLEVKRNSAVIAYGYWCSNYDDEDKSVVLISVNDKCIDAGIVIKGKIYTGDSGYAGKMQTLNNSDDLETALIQMIVYVQEIIDPSVIAITGELTELDINDIIQEGRCCISESGTASIIYVKSVKEELKKGLVNLALNNLEI